MLQNMVANQREQLHGKLCNIVSTHLGHPVVAIQKVDVSLHGVAAVLHEVLQGDGGCAKEPYRHKNKSYYKKTVSCRSIKSKKHLLYHIKALRQLGSRSS